jgi:hypothetical protein
MTNIKKFQKFENLIFYIFFCIVIISTSCSKKITFLNSPIVPAARGTVQLKTDKNNNFDIDVILSDLAESSRLTPAKQTYIVWMVTDQNITKNIGQLNSSKSGLANKLKASFKTVSAFKPTKIFITAEDEPNTQYPSEQIIITTDFFNN